MAVRIEPGYLTTAIGLGGAGALGVWPGQWFIGVGLMTAAAFTLAFGVRIEGWHVGATRFWPPVSQRRIPIHEAAQRMYKAMERSGFDDLVETDYSSPHVKLDYFKYVILTEACKEKITLHGTKPPSRQSRPIPVSELNGLRPVEGRSTLVCSALGLTYQDVWLSERELDRLIRERLALLKRLDGNVL